jgi:hypothetical protein
MGRAGRRTKPDPDKDPKTKPKMRKRRKKRRKFCSTDHLSDHVRRRRLHREALFSHRRWRAFWLLRVRTGSKRFARHWVSCRGSTD